MLYGLSTPQSYEAFWNQAKNRKEFAANDELS
jgi:hypothetical protein